ncbi:MAG TPA: transglutaminase-like domain-containing protein [Candidatus Lokiarchaeia archaeon]|nr:transglutaminase-like domain-containing protein [Candidatus Lokiarchaeia archaeon]
MDDKEIDLIIGLNGRIIIKRTIEGIWNENSLATGFSFSTLIPTEAISGKMHDGNNLKVTAHRNQNTYDIIFPKPLYPHQKYSIELNIVPKESFVEKLGSLKIIEWPKELLSKIVFLNNADKIFFSSALAQITTDENNKHRIIVPDPFMQKMQSPTRDSKTVRIEWGEQPNIKLRFTYTISNTGPSAARDVIILTRLPPSTKFQDTSVQTKLQSQKLVDDDQNEIFGFGVPLVEPGSTKDLFFTADIKPKGNKVLLTPSFGNDQEYRSLIIPNKYGSEIIKPSKYWNFQEPNVQALIKQLKAKSASKSDLIKAVFEFVNTNMHYYVNNMRDNAANALKTLSGDCSEYADLTIALLRAAKIPAKLIIGWVIHLKDWSLGPHGWVEFFSPKHGWIQCDPTWGYLVGVSCQHVCRQREGLIHDQPNYQYKFHGNTNINVDEKVVVESII